MRQRLLIVFFLIIGLQAFSQSAWVQLKGGIYTQLSYNDISDYNRIFNKNGGDLYTSRRISDRVFQWYTEIGLADKITIITSVPFKIQKSGELVREFTAPVTIDEGNLNAFGNIGIAGRYQLIQKKYNVALQFQVDLPTSKFDADTGLSTGIDAFSFIPTVAIGRGIGDWFYQGNTGISLRTNNYSTQFKFYVEGGKKFFDQLWIIAFIDIVESLENGSRIDSSQSFQTYLNLNDSEYGGFGVKLIEELTSQFGITAAVGGAFSGHLEAHRASLNFGVYFKSKR